MEYLPILLAVVCLALWIVWGLLVLAAGKRADERRRTAYLLYLRERKSGGPDPRD